MNIKAIKRFLKRRLRDFHVNISPFNFEKVNLGRLVVFKVSKKDAKVDFQISENFTKELGYSNEDIDIDNVCLQDVIDKESGEVFIGLLQYTIEKREPHFKSGLKFISQSSEAILGRVYINIEYDERGWVALNGFFLSLASSSEEDGAINVFDFANDYIEQKVQEEVANFRYSLATDIISSIAHQWRQPLNIISMYFQDIYIRLALDEFYPKDYTPEQKLEFFESEFEALRVQVENQLQYLSDVIDGFRNNLTNEGWKITSSFSLKELIDDVLKLVEPLLKRDNIQLINGMKVDNIEVVGYRNILKQVVLNLIHNSIDIFRERNIQKRTIILKSYITSDNQLGLMVADNGGGIDPEVLPKIFDPYFTTRHQTRGTGLGLYMSRKFIREEFNGDIYVSNRRSCTGCKNLCQVNYKGDEGACFQIVLPKFATNEDR